MKANEFCYDQKFYDLAVILMEDRRATDLTLKRVEYITKYLAQALQNTFDEFVANNPSIFG